MDLFSKNKVLLKLVIVLLLINIISLTYFWMQRRPEDKGRPPKRDIEKVAAGLKDKLGLRDDQVESLKRIREDFFRKEESLSNQIRMQRDSMNAGMFDENMDTLLIKKIARRLVENEYKMEVYRIEQAIQLRNLCNPEQLKKFQGINMEIRDYFQPKKKKD